MKVFWSDEQGNSPPEDAIFSACLFTETVPVPFENVTFVKELPLSSKPIRIVKRTFTPNREEWIEGIKRTQKSGISKVVLARCCELECEEAPDPFAIAARLLEKAKNSTVFCFQDGDAAFVGATPEILFSRENNKLTTEALAGTRLRGEDETAFLQSKKDLSEIEPVIDYLQKNLSFLSFSPISIKKTSNLLHLHAKGTGTIPSSVSDAQILEKIHPTPALCGLPKQQALDWIQKIEPFERGLYGGILGWSTKEKSTWIVAIRCCFIQGNTVKLYTGAGIVPLSNPEKEWEELNNKMALYEDIFI